jgi:hypothetical protein
MITLRRTPRPRAEAIARGPSRRPDGYGGWIIPNRSARSKKKRRPKAPQQK